MYIYIYIFFFNSNPINPYLNNINLNSKILIYIFSNIHKNKYIFSL